MRFFSHIQTLDELKKEYRRLCRIHHPDLGGDAETMKLLNVEYEQVLQSQSFQDHFAADDCRTDIETEHEMREVLELLTVIEGITVEICGTWIWVTGNTYPVKDQLKAAGLKFAKKKVAWYWKPAWSVSRGRGKFGLDEIRAMHGSKTVKTDKTEEKYAIA